MLGSWLTRARLSKLRRAKSFDDSFYEESTKEEWKVLKSHTTSKEEKKKKSQLTSEDMLFMQTNILSAIPECFDLQAPFEHVKVRDVPKERRPPRTSESLKKKSPNEPYVRSGIPPPTSNSLLKQERRTARENNEQQRKQNTDGTRSEPRGLSSDDVIPNPSSSNGETNYTYQKMRSKVKLKTKTKVCRKRSKTAPPLRRTPHVEEEVSLSEFRRLETRISFASYVKRRTPLFSFSKTIDKPKFNKLRRTKARNDIKLCGISGIDRDLEDKSDVIFNPIFEDEEPEEITSSVENMSMCSEADPHVADTHYDVIPNHVTRNSKHHSTKNVTFDLNCPEEEPENNTLNTENFRKRSETGSHVLDKNDDVIPNHRIRNSQHYNTKNVTFDLNGLEEEPENNTLNKENFRKRSETGSHVLVKNDDAISNHVKRPPLRRSHHVEEEEEVVEEELETTDISVDLNALLNHDDEYDYEFSKCPIMTFDTTSIRRDLYIIDEEPENELVFDP